LRNSWHGTTFTDRGIRGPLTEVVLLGPRATRSPNTTLEWNAKKMKFDHAEANQYVKRTYRKAWEVKGLG
jgi:hypothetical protein